MLYAFPWTLLILASLPDSCYLQRPNPPVQHWDYQREGPDAWHHMFDTCEGDAQSPIDIRTSRVRYEPSLSPLSLNGYTTNMSSLVWNLTHNGHAIVAYPPPLARLSISGGGLPDVFYLLQFHLHWGYNAFQGSEHTINGRRYPLEIHFVHRAPFTGALAVLGILFDRQRDDNPYLNDLLSIVNRTTNASVAIERQIDISRLFPTSPSPRFFRYNGSLTTPPCTEGITWTVLARTVPISSYQLSAFAANSVPFNFRPTQKLHTRKVLANFRPEPEEGVEEEEAGTAHHSSASSARVAVVLLLVLLTVNVASILHQ